MRLKEVSIHIISWLAFSLIVFYWQTNMFEDSDALIQTARMISIGMALFYLNLYVLLPRFFESNQFIKYSLSILVILAVAYFLFFLTNDLSPRPEMRNPRGMKEGVEMRDRPPMPPRNMSRMVIFTIINGIPMLFFSTIIWLSDENRKRKQREAALINENLESEMRFLKSQINPHFLFNALNNIYSLSLTKSEKAPQLIIKLSEMLRHVVYHNTSPVKLENEIGYIQNFIDFQNLKIGEPIDVSFHHEEANKHLIIEPMLLIPFVENAFKHSNIENDPKGFIHIAINTQHNKVIFDIRNSIPTMQHTKDKTSGIGIENVTKRLAMGYPGKFQFLKEIEQNVFHVNLQIDCK